METKSFLNPYELLGVTPTSSLKDIKTAYHTISLLCHPDKGGDARDMKAVHAAYKFVRDHLHETDKTIQDFVNEFSEFCNIDQIDSDTITWANIYKECWDISIDQTQTEFDHNAFENNTTESAVVNNLFLPCANLEGYGKYMSDDLEGHSELEFNDEKSIVHYSEPLNIDYLKNRYNNNNEYLVNLLDDYGGYASMFDYRKAFCKYNTIPEHERFKDSVKHSTMSMYEQECALRGLNSSRVC